MNQVYLTAVGHRTDYFYRVANELKALMFSHNCVANTAAQAKDIDKEMNADEDESDVDVEEGLPFNDWNELKAKFDVKEYRDKVTKEWLNFNPKTFVKAFLNKYCGKWA